MTSKAISLLIVIINAALVGGDFLPSICEIYHDKCRRTSLTDRHEKTYDVRGTQDGSCRSDIDQGIAQNKDGPGGLLVLNELHGKNARVVRL